MTQVTPEIEGKWRQLRRLLISYNDFKHASDIAHYFTECNYVVDRTEWDGDDYYEKKTKGEALNEALLVSYGRPFSGNDKTVENKIPDLPGRYLRLLDKKGKAVHQLALSRRNKIVAHSDSDAWEMAPHTLRFDNGRVIIAPISNDTLAPLSVEEMFIISSNCGVFMDAILEERKALEVAIETHLPEVGGGW